jgi:hypothetical protein
MSTVFKFISNNTLIAAPITAAILAAVGGIWKWWRDRRDSDTIYKFMLDSKSRTDFDFRSTSAIASHTKLPPERVAALCARHPKIRRNEKEKESWTLLD